MTSLVTQTVKKSPVIQETWVWVLGGEDPLEKVMAIHTSILAWRIPWTEETGGLQSMGLQRVRHDWATIAFFQEMTRDPRPLHGGRRGICTLSHDIMSLGKNQLWSLLNRSYIYFEVLMFQMSMRKCEKIQMNSKIVLILLNFNWKIPCWVANYIFFTVNCLKYIKCSKI